MMGGIESHCQQLYPRLVKKGAQVTILARSPYVSESKSIFEDVEVISVWALRHKFLETFLHTFVAIIYARLFIKPDVLHIHAIGPALFTPFACLLGFKVIVTHHGADYERQKWNRLAKVVLKFGETMAIKFSKKVLVVGKSLTKQLQEEYPTFKSKIDFVPNGAFAEFNLNITQMDLEKTGLGLEPGSYILTVGRLVPEKGFHDLIAAFQNAKCDLKLVIVGQADHTDEYSTELFEQQSESILFAGRRSGNQLEALYKYARLFVLPSYHEGLPIVALEAISADTPILLSDIQPNLDIALDTVNYFKVGDRQQLSEKLQETIPKAPKERILGDYDWDNIAQQTWLSFSHQMNSSY